MARTTGSAYADLARAKLKSIIASPGLFAMRSLGDAALVSLETVAPLVLVYRFGSVAGWSGAEVAMLIALGRAGEGLALVFGRGVDPTVFGETIRLGRFDQVLTRPVSPLAWLLTTDVELRFVFRTIAGTAIAAWAARQAGVTLSLANVAILSAAVVSCAVLVLSILVIGASITFRTIEGSEVANLVANGGIGLVSFPLDLYSGVLRFTFTFIMPVGLCVYVPVLTMLGRDGPGPLGPGLLGALPVALVMMVGGAGLAWRQGLRHYQSTGS